MDLINKLHNFKDCFENSRIYNIYYNEQIDDKIIYFESRNGNDFTGNIFRIVEEVSTGKYGDFKIYVYATEDIKNKIINFQKNYNLKIHKIITDENEACRILEKAKYIFTDSGIRSKYIKKEGQIVVNTWHGTPLKLMGFDNPSERPSLGIIQKSLLYSDYLLYPNEYMMNKMLNAYMIEKIYPGKILLEGYPRNTVFLNENKREEFRKRLNLNKKEVFVYMPTFKGIVSERKDEKQKNDVTIFLDKIDLNLKDNQILFVKLHPYNQSQIDFSKYNNIKSFPKGFENYDILNASDCLITDYSSVFFDFATTGRKIVIFNYDEDEYFKDRGIYFSLKDLPFPKARNIDELIGELNLEKNYDDENFIEEFCKYDAIDSTESICETIFNNKNECEIKIIENTNKNILIYVEGLEDNDVVNSLIQMLEDIDESEYNIFISFKSWHKNIKENYLTLLESFPEYVEFLPLNHNVVPTVGEKIKLNKFLKNNQNHKFYDSLKKLFERYYIKQYLNITFEQIIIYYNSNLIELLMFVNSNVENLIYVANTNNVVNENFNQVYGLGEKINFNE